MRIKRWTSSKMGKPIKKIRLHTKNTYKGGENMELTLNKQVNDSNYSQKKNIYEKLRICKFLKSKENITLNCIKYIEDDNSITLSLEDFDIVVNESNYNKAISSIIYELKEYIEDYIQEPEYWTTDKKRKKEIEYLIKLFKDNDENKIRTIIKCRDGEI